MGSKVAMPEARNYGEETRDTLQAQLDLAPDKFAAEAKYAPQYQQLQMDLLNRSAPQLMDLYENVITPGMTRTEMASRTAGREADINDLSRLGPQARKAQAAMAPNESAMVDSLVNTAKSDLAAGTSLTPAEMRAAQQQSRAAYGDRGLIAGPQAAMGEVLNAQAGGQAAKQRRMANAASAIGQSQGFYGDQFSQILGRQSGAFGASQGAFGQAAGMNPGMLFNPESQYAGDINNQAWQGQLSANTANAANKTALISAGIGAAGKMAGGAMGGGM